MHLAGCEAKPDLFPRVPHTWQSRDGDPSTSQSVCLACQAEKTKEINVANIKSQKKRIKTNEKRRLRNKSYKSELKTYVRKTREAIEAGDAEEAEKWLRVASRKLDVAVSKGVIHKNQAAQRKSKLAKRFNKLSA